MQRYWHSNRGWQWSCWNTNDLDLICFVWSKYLEMLSIIQHKVAEPKGVFVQNPEEVGRPDHTNNQLKIKVLIFHACQFMMLGCSWLLYMFIEYVGPQSSKRWQDWYNFVEGIFKLWWLQDRMRKFYQFRVWYNGSYPCVRIILNGSSLPRPGPRHELSNLRLY